MNINSLSGNNPGMGIMSFLNERAGRSSNEGSGSQALAGGRNDAVDWSQAPMSDEEAESVLGQLMSDIPTYPGQALTVHNGLNPARVNQLLSFDF